MNTTLSAITVKQLQKVIKIKAKLEALQEKLEDVLALDGGEIPIPSGTRKRRMSASARAKISAAQRARWAKIRGTSKEKPGKQTRRKMSAAGRAAIAAAARARWAKAKASGKNRL
jgi:hypothetical protein